MSLLKQWNLNQVLATLAICSQYKHKLFSPRKQDESGQFTLPAPFSP